MPLLRMLVCETVASVHVSGCVLPGACKSSSVCVSLLWHEQCVLLSRRGGRALPWLCLCWLKALVDQARPIALIRQFVAVSATSVAMVPVAVRSHGSSQAVVPLLPVRAAEASRPRVRMPCV